MLFVSKICIHTSLRLEVEILWHIVHFTTHLQFYIYSNPFQWIFVIHRKDENRLCDSVITKNNFQFLHFARSLPVAFL